MINFNINGIEELKQKIQMLSGTAIDNMLLDIATTLKGELRHRIHVEGKASDGSPIGTYSHGYMEVRKLHNRNSDKKVVLSLTRQMENDMQATQPIKIQNGYGIGYSNKSNYEKAIKNEMKYKKSIWQLTDREQEIAEHIVIQYVENINNI